MHDVDLARSTDAIRLSLISANIRAAWSCSPARDRRRESIFTLIPTAFVAAPAGHAVRVVTDFCISHGHHVSRHEVEVTADSILVTVTLAEPDVTMCLESEVREARNFFAMHSLMAAFTPSVPVIDLPYPSTIATTHRSSYPDQALLQELDGWVDKFK